MEGLLQVGLGIDQYYTLVVGWGGQINWPRKLSHGPPAILIQSTLLVISSYVPHLKRPKGGVEPAIR